MTERTGIYTNDLDVLKAFGHQVEAIDQIKSGFVVSGNITIASTHGYLLGEIWYDTDADAWRLDTSKYGQDA